MVVGLIGLGRMGLGIAKRLLNSNFVVLGYDPNNVAMESFKQLGGVPSTYDQIAQMCEIIWLMVPENYVASVITELKNILMPGQIIIDGGNSYYKNSKKHFSDLKKLKISFLDCGTSGGLHGEDNGYCLMIGGDKEIFNKCVSVFTAIAINNGFSYIGVAGSGHYIKMIHNGIEYSLLQSYAEGFELLKNGEYKDLDLEKISNLWLHGSIIRSWILDLAHQVFKNDQDFKDVSGKIGGGQTGSWALSAANEFNIDMPMLQKALKIRDASNNDDEKYSAKLIAMLRYQFGGHQYEKK